MEDHIKGFPVISHNASFDVAILNHHLQRLSRQTAVEQYACTVEVAKALLPGLDNHRLSTLTDLFGIQLDHHDPTSDAIACAELGLLFDRIAPDGLKSFLRPMSEFGRDSNGVGFINVQVNGSSQRMRANQFDSICKCCKVEVQKGTGVLQRLNGKWIVQCLSCFKPIEPIMIAVPDSRFAGLKFVFTGTFSLLGRENAEKVAKAQGGRVMSSVSKMTDYVVASDEEHSKYKRDGCATTKLDKAFELAADGRKVKILTEAEYVEMLEFLTVMKGTQKIISVFKGNPGRKKSSGIGSASKAAKTHIVNLYTICYDARTHRPRALAL